jgi:hypothetical protein
MEIRIESEVCSADRLMGYINSLAPLQDGQRVELRVPDTDRVRGLDVAVVAALISGGSSVLVSLITGLFLLLKDRQGKKMVVHTKTGQEEVHGYDDEKKLLSVVERLNGAMIERIVLVRSNY